MSGGVFICYRREETAFAARAIYDRVAQKVGRENVFLDVDNIELGVDWFDALNERVAACDALVAVIGRNWVVADKDNRRRIDDPDDFVRIEIEAALKRGVRLIPVLVDGALMPKTGDLPDSLRGLARRQNIEISHTRFETDVDKLTRALVSILESVRSRQTDKIGGALQAQQKSAGSNNVEPALTSTETEETRRHRVAADRGDANGQVNLGWLYEQGSGGLPQEDREAARLYKLAAAQGNAGAQANLGAFYGLGRGGLPKDEREAARLYKLAADQGNAGGQANLATLYRDGLGGLPKDEREAARLYRLAANQGNAWAQVNLGLFYEKGLGGLRKDHRQAARRYRLAAGQGNALGQAYLGDFYEFARGGLATDVVEAKRLYRLAAAQGNDWAQKALKRLEEN